MVGNVGILNIWIKNHLHGTILPGQALILGIGAIMFVGRSISRRNENGSTNVKSKQKSADVDEITNVVYQNIVKVKWYRFKDALI